jgi:hypothetical protein
MRDVRRRTREIMSALLVQARSAAAGSADIATVVSEVAALRASTTEPVAVAAAAAMPGPPTMTDPPA